MIQTNLFQLAGSDFSGHLRPETHEWSQEPNELGFHGLS
jgi:hypothetical protein